MKPIKFRAKSIKSNVWVSGYYCYNNMTHEHHIISDMADGKIHDWHVRPLTIGQYTGFVDYNGSYIYEGDILKCHKDDMKHAFRSVVFQHGCYCLRDWFATTPMSNHNIKSWEVVGNIYDDDNLVDIVNGKEKGGAQ